MKTWYYADKNKLYAEQNRNKTNLLADKIREGIMFDHKLTENFHKITEEKFTIVPPSQSRKLADRQ